MANLKTSTDTAQIWLVVYLCLKYPNKPHYHKNVYFLKDFYVGKGFKTGHTYMVRTSTADRYFGQISITKVHVVHIEKLIT